MSYEPSYLAFTQRSPLLDQLEFYVTWKLADDPTRDGNAIIDEFFARYYGSAAKPMKTFYELMEQIYANFNNYPPNLPGGHQTEEVAWKYLGTQSRMEQLGWLMDQATAAAKTDIEKRRGRCSTRAFGITCKRVESSILQRRRQSDEPIAGIVDVVGCFGKQSRVAGRRDR